MGKKAADTRNLALTALVQVLEKGAFLHLAMGETLADWPQLKNEDRAFFTRLVRGVVERKITLDYLLDQVSERPVEKMKPLIRNILRMGVYQIVYLDGVPDRAACAEAVRLAKKRGLAGLSGFVNGVLRQMVREKEGLLAALCKEGDGEDMAAAARLSVRYSMPAWLTDRFLAAYGRENCQRLLQAFLNDRPVTIRPNPERISPEELEALLKAEGIGCRRLADPPFAMEIEGFGRLDRIPAFRQGLFYVQDPASMQVAVYADPKPGSRVLDLCGAPGGKSIQIAQMLKGTGSVLVRDLSAEKTDLIRENIARSGLSNIRAQVWDALVPDPALAGEMDIVIADLPCSGLGVAGRKADIRYRLQAEDIGRLADLQRRMLGVAASYVRPGGSLIYSTCTITAEENQENADWFLDRHPDFMETARKQYMPWDGTDGFFLAKFLRNS